MMSRRLLTTLLVSLLLLPIAACGGYELEGTHYQEAQIELVWEDSGCREISLAQAVEKRVVWNIRNADL